METKATVGGEGAIIHTGNHVKLKKCAFTGHCAAIWSVENAIQVLDQIGFLTDSDDCLPFAIRLVENGELIQIAEDNGEFGCGDVLADCLSKLDKYNVLVCVSRRISDSFVLDMYQRQILNCVREAGNSAVDRIHSHFLGLENRQFIPQPEFDDDIVSIPSSARKASPTRQALHMQRISIDPSAMLPDNDGIALARNKDRVGGKVAVSLDFAVPAALTTPVSHTKKKLRESIHRGRSLGTS